MAEGVAELKADLRDQVTRAGLGERLARTWRSAVYPSAGESLDPAGVVSSKAPRIVSSFADGATIRPVNGSRFLAIPTENVPRGRGRGQRAKMTVFEVETHFNQDLVLRPGRNGSIVGFVHVLAGRSGRGFRRKTAGRVAQGRKSKLVPMFVFVRQAKAAKLLDLPAAAGRAASLASRRLKERLS